jgi:hypothetical protein
MKFRVLYQAPKMHSASIGRTKREVPTRIRGKSGDFVHAAFHVKISPCPSIKTTLMHSAKRFSCSNVLAWPHALPIWLESLLNYWAGLCLRCFAGNSGGHHKKP